MAKTKPGRRMRRWDGPKDASEEKLTLKKRENLDYEEALRQNAENRFSLSVADLPIEVPPGGDKDVFRKNIQFFIEQNRMKPATVAKQARISFELLRQWLRRGLARPQKGSRDSLDRLRKFFLLDSMAELWSDQLIDSLKQTERRAAQMHPFLRSTDWPYAVKFMELLQSGEYDFLRDLIGKLYGQETATVGQSPRGGQEGGKAPAKNLAEYRRSRKAEGDHRL